MPLMFVQGPSSKYATLLPKGEPTLMVDKYQGGAGVTEADLTGVVVTSEGTTAPYTPGTTVDPTITDLKLRAVAFLRRWWWVLAILAVVLFLRRK